MSAPARLAGVAGLVAVHVALGLALAGDRSLLPGDGLADDVMTALRFDAGIDVVAVLTDVLGSFPAVSLLAGAAAAVAWQRGRRDQAAALVAGVLLIVLAVEVTKELWGRERPLQALAAATGLSYPSGHSAYATTWIAAAAALGGRRALAAAAAVTMAVGMSRLYLEVHFLSDVLGGLALGGAVHLLLLRR